MHRYIKKGLRQAQPLMIFVRMCERNRLSPVWGRRQHIITGKAIHDVAHNCSKTARTGQLDFCFFSSETTRKGRSESR